MMLIYIPFYAKDRERAMKLARWIADFDSKARTDVQIVLVNRFDAEAPDDDTIARVQTTFPVSHFRSTTKKTGWPDGCNAMAFDILRDAKEAVEDGLVQRGDPILIMEPDCVPVHRDWIFMLLSEWVRLEPGKLVMGAWRKSGPECGHVNGNALFDADILRLIPGIEAAIASIRGTAWDAALAPYFEKYWHFTGLISNHWNENTLTDEQIETPWIGTLPPVLIHGCKSDDVWKYAQRKLSQ